MFSRPNDDSICAALDQFMDQNAAMQREQYTRQVNQWMARAQDFGDPPGPQSRDAVEIHFTGEELSEPTFWQGNQWAVTAYGLEQRDGTYQIPFDQVWGDDPSGYGWVPHMAGNQHVDMPDFVEALRVARMILVGKFNCGNEIGTC